MPRFGKKTITLILIIVLVSTVLGCTDGYTEHISTVFSSTMTFSVKINRGREQAAIDEMLAVAEELDKSVNLSRADSYLSAFNRADANERVAVDEHIYKLTLAAKEVYEQTNGAFNPTLAPLSKAWGVDNEGVSRFVYGTEVPESLPDYDYLTSLEPLTDFSAVTAEKEGDEYYLNKTVQGLKLDFGGIAKGYCADLFRDIALRYGAESALISISGNLVFIGKNQTSGKAWTVGINNPRPDNSSPYACGFSVNDTTVVTSGDYERYYSYGGLRISHIINGSSLCPVGVRRDGSGYAMDGSWVSSCTVVGESSLYADAYSTAACVMGAVEGAKLLEERGYKGVIFTSDYKYKTVGNISLLSSETLYQREYTPL